MEFNEILNKMINEKYYTSKELKYDSKVNILMNPYKYTEFLKYIQNNDEPFYFLDIKNFNKGKLHLCFCNDLLSLLNEYLDNVIRDSKEFDNLLLIRKHDDIIINRILSEIEGTLRTESVETSRKIVQDIILKNKPCTNRNEVIVKNMANGIEFVNKCPDFNKENLFKLYNILSDDCLDEKDKLLEGYYYRHDDVEVDNYKGCPYEKIDECMNSLFDFININLSNYDLKYYLPHIAHYYIVYIHPYFDYNGRTARMVSFWISLLTNNLVLPPLISEAINLTKKDYYASLRESRDSYNDLTYFLLYIYKTSINYYLVYKNIENIEQELKNEGILISKNDIFYIKSIMINVNGSFVYEDLFKWTKIKMSKQGALKILNNLEKINVLSSKTVSNKKLFSLNKDCLKYSMIK